MINRILCKEAAAYLNAGHLDGRIRLVLTSPPYDDLREYRGYTFNVGDMLRGIERALVPGGVCVWIMTDQTKNGERTGTSFRHALTAQEVGLRIHDTMIWRKTNPLPGNRGSRYIDCFEYMFVFSKGTPEVFNVLTEPSKSAGVKTSFQYASGNKGQDKKETIVSKERPRWNIWEYSASKTSTTKHPATFPIKLAEDHVRTWSNRGDLVLDPMVGSGTTCIASKHLGRDYLGLDISEDYCKLAQERLKNTDPLL